MDIAIFGMLQDPPSNFTVLANAISAYHQFRWFLFQEFRRVKWAIFAEPKPVQ
jgi:hypothetical protein